MSRRKRIVCIVGTRPEAIKLAPLILALRQQPWCDLRLVVTAQHRGMLDQVPGRLAWKPITTST